MQQSGKGKRPPADETKVITLHKRKIHDKDGAIDWYEVSEAARAFWKNVHWPSCRNCGHWLAAHVFGLCCDCKHECKLSVDTTKLEAFAIAAAIAVNLPLSEENHRSVPASEIAACPLHILSAEHYIPKHKTEECAGK